jgi:alkylation response protein AidB-like acyl-CoA dehydrogenase
MYALNEQQKEIAARAAEVAGGVIAANAADVDREARFPAEAVAALGEAGLLGLTVPAEFGGMGQGLGTMAAVLDQLAQRDASAAMVTLMHYCGVSCYAANPGIAGEHLRAAAAGKHLSTLAWSEKGSRSHFWAPVSMAVAGGGDGGVRVSAEKSWVTSAGHADGYVVSTRAAGGAAPTETALYLVLKGDPGVTVDGPWESLGMRGNASAPMKLQDVELDGGRALCEPGKGFEFMLGVVLPWFQIGNAAVSIGVAEAAVQATTAHLTGAGFQHMGTKLADLPNLRARLARMRIETDKARAHLAKVIEAAESGDPSATLMVLESKASAGDAALTVTDLAMKACGGAAFSRHLSVERNFRDARAMSVMAPTSDVLHEFIGRALCGMELF